MLMSIEGVYENGMVRLLEPLPNDLKQARVVVTVLPDALPTRSVPFQAIANTEEILKTSSHSPTGDAVVDDYQPRTELGRRLIALRRTHIEQGGTLVSWDEIDAEVRERRGGAID